MLSLVMRRVLLAGVATGALVAPAMGQTAPAKADASETVFVLGRVSELADSDGQRIGGAAISQETMTKLDLASVDKAVNLVTGATASNTGGSRNERLIFVRGFDRIQTPLSIDGVRVFLPADNRIDFARFLTSDLAEIQVSKGFVSVLDGPGALGGAVNLVTRKPSKALEIEGGTGVTASHDGDVNSESYSALIGTRQDLFYVQASGSTTDRDSWSLPDSFKPTTLEDGGERGNSASQDWRVNVKAGFTPNDTDEYAISYTRSSGQKNAPYHITDTASTRFWSWPYWDLDSIYFLSRTKLGERFTLKSRVYYNTFQNLLESFDSAAQTTQTLPRSFKSYYDDTAYGANLTLEAALSDANTLKAAFHYRKDEHNERQYGFTRTPATGNPSVNTPYIEPWQPTEEDTYSIALEDTWALGDTFDLVLGASYDWTRLIDATDTNVQVTGTTIANSVISFLPVVYEKKDMEGVNGQAALVWHVADNARLHTSLSSRTRFPTLFERFSSRFGTAVPNPDVKPERATNFEVGGDVVLSPGVKVEGAVFYSDVADALLQVPVGYAAPLGAQNQTKNVGDAKYYGAEIGIEAQVTDWLDVGANATYMRRILDDVAPVVGGTGGTLPPITGADPTNPGFQLQGQPDFKAFVYADWHVTPSITVTPSLEMASDRWTVTAVGPFRFYQTGGYALANLAAQWQVTDNVSLLAGVKNLGDETYTLVDGFPEEGRNFYASVRFRN